MGFNFNEDFNPEKGKFSFWLTPNLCFWGWLLAWGGGSLHNSEGGRGINQTWATIPRAHFCICVPLSFASLQMTSKIQQQKIQHFFKNATKDHAGSQSNPTVQLNQICGTELKAQPRLDIQSQILNWKLSSDIFDVQETAHQNLYSSMFHLDICE